MSDAELIIGNYKLLSCISSGQQSQVWDVAEVNSSDRFAMKLLLPEAFKDAEQKNALKHEARVAKSLAHPNLIGFHEISITKEHAFFTMELFRAPNLKGQIQNEMVSLHLRLKRLIELTGLSLAHMHEKGWIHRDIKPDNILFSKGSELRVIDFSLASRPTGGGIGALFKSKKNILVQGTRTYMAPEQIKKQPLTFQTDIYNFGVTVFELLTGKTPFQGTSPDDLLRKHVGTPPPPPSSINENVTPEMDRVVLKMLAKKPANRHKDMNEFLAEFRMVNLFRESPDKLAAAKAEAELNAQFSLNDRLDSRTDAMREKKLGGAKPAARPAAAKEPQPQPLAPQPQRPQQQPMQPAAARPGVPPQNPPGMPPRPGQPPVMPMPGGAYPPGMAPPGAMPPGMPPQPGMPQPGMPQRMPAAAAAGQPPPGMPGAGALPPGYRPPPGGPPQGAPPRPGPGAGYPQPPGMPGYPPPQGMPPAGYPQPPGMPPGYPPPPQGMPPQGYPPQMRPGQPPVSGQPVPGMPPGARPPVQGPPGQPMPQQRPPASAPQQRPPANAPRPAAPPPAPPPTDADLGDFNIS